MQQVLILGAYSQEVSSALRLLRDSRTDINFISDKQVAQLNTPSVYLCSDRESLALRLLLENGERFTTDNLSREISLLDAEYSFNKNDLYSADIVLDTTGLATSEICEIILSRIAEHGMSQPIALFSEDKLNFPDDEADAELIAEYSELVDLGEDVPLAEAVYRDGEMYVIAHIESALAYSFFTEGLIPIRLVDTDISDINFVKMKNSL